MSGNRKKLLWAAAAAVAAIFTALLLVSANTESIGPSAAVAPNAPPPAPAAVPEKAAPGDRLEAELVAVGPRGFEPPAITRPAREFLLIVDNRTGLDRIQVRVERVTGRERLYDVALTKKEFTWNTLLRLPPGDYVLTEAGHPDWVCRLTLTTD